MNAQRVFEFEMEARDYECDLQGIVNNSVYLNYFEHTRHKFLATVGLAFGELHRQGIDPVVSRIEIDYRRSLKGGDRFISGLRVEWKGRLQLLFRQRLLLVADGEEMAQAINYVVFVNGGKPISRPEKVVQAVETWWSG